MGNTVTLIHAPRLAEVVPRFQEYLETDGQGWLAERRHKAAFFEEHLSPGAIHEMDEGTLRELVHLLWAFSGWTHKDWVYSQILKSGLATVQDALWQLLYGDDLLEHRFDFVKHNIRMMGAAAISEILAQHDPGIYPIWNKRSRRGLIALGVPDPLLPRSSQISGAQYVSYAALMRSALAEVREPYPLVDDLLALDFLFYALDRLGIGSEEPAPGWNWAADSGDFGHDEVIDQLLQLGDGLGFEVDKEVPVVPGCRIDAVWRTRVANLGTICYAFEVHRRGNRDSAIMNLQRASTDPSIQKVVVVAQRAELDIFRREIASLPERFRAAVGYFDVSELQHALDHLHTLKGTLNTLGLLNTSTMFD